MNKKIGKKQYLVPYLMSSHPGSTVRDAIKLAEYLNEHHINPQQVQDFYPTPGTISTCMFYTGLDPFTMKKVYVAKSPKEKAMQRALLQYRNPENYAIVYEALTKCGRTDLIGYHDRCLIRPPKGNILNETRRNNHGKAVNGQGGFGKNKGRAENQVAELKEKGINPALAVIIVGEDPASKVYVNNKKKACEYCGIRSLEYALPEETTQEELLELIEKLNMMIPYQVYYVSFRCLST